ncbi:MAG: hypothetical protein JM57_07635 [Comamonadaceae bacterium BICA1-1]|nr:MAG: hypothetical protein JM57_07635 [Comamonadaceae bacterium BICA1-1]
MGWLLGAVLLVLAVSAPAGARASATGATAVAADDRPVLTLGVFAYRPKPVMLQRFGALGGFLSEQVDSHRFEVRAYTGPEMQAAMEVGEVDFVLTNPVHFHVLREYGALSGSLASMVMRSGNQPLHGIGGVIVRRADRTDIATLRDLRERRIAVSGRESLGSYMAPMAELLQAGVPLQSLHLIETGQPVDRVVEAVLGGAVDAGFVRTSVLEDLEREGKLQADQLVVLNPQNVPGFPLQLSTRLYPEWPFLAAIHVPPELSHRVAVALMSLRPTDAAALSAGVYGFSIPADYSAVEQAMRGLRLAPFDVEHQTTWADIWQRYQLWIGALAAAVALVLLLALGLAINTVRLVRIKRDLQADRTALQRQREELARLAHFDALTGLPNRRMLQDRLNLALARARRNTSLLALCYLDLDNFKPINDQLGHAAGDRFLIEIAQRLQQGLRADDTVARLGGDEFVLLLTDLASEEEWQIALRRTMERLRQPVAIDGHEVASSASVGVVLFSGRSSAPADPDSLLRQADQAMYQAKQEGRSRYRVVEFKA